MCICEYIFHSKVTYTSLRHCFGSLLYLQEVELRALSF